MGKRVLVLNQDFSPMAVCSVQRAFLLIYLRKAEMLTTIADQYLRTVNDSYPMPSVIRINRYIPIPYRGVVLTRQNVFKRDNYECQYCGSTKDLTLDHLIPRSKGGKSSWKNLVTACKICNARKGDYDLEEVDMELKRYPYKPSYIMFIKDSSGYVRDEWRPFLEPHSVAG